jgi:GWxTD domain-containing protein
MKRRALGLGLSAFLIFSSCALRPAANLDPPSREFLSKVRFLITKSERRAFLQLPASERQEFIADFWKKRDPSPGTEVNEFKDTYFKRIDEANQLLRDGNEPGWMQDRGRIYILLGPPSNRETYPRGITFYGKPCEVWYYGFFPIWFVDEAWNGTYRLDPDSAQQLAEIMSVQMYLKPVVVAEKGGVTELPAEVIDLDGGKKAVRIALPYNQIWFSAEGEKFQTILSLSIEIHDQKDAKVWEFSRDYPLEIDKRRLASYLGTDYLIEVPLEVPPSAYDMTVEIKSSADGSRARKRISLSQSDVGPNLAVL